MTDVDTELDTQTKCRTLKLKLRPRFARYTNNADCVVMRKLSVSFVYQSREITKKNLYLQLYSPIFNKLTYLNWIYLVQIC